MMRLGLLLGLSGCMTEASPLGYDRLHDAAPGIISQTRNLPPVIVPSAIDTLRGVACYQGATGYACVVLGTSTRWWIR